MDAVVLQEGCQHRIVGQVIDRYNFELVRAAHQVSKGQSTDSAKAIDCNARSHRE
jgi:hypothetical protein